MALRKTLAEKLCNIKKISKKALTNGWISSPEVQYRTEHKPEKVISAVKLDPGDGKIGNCNGNDIFRRNFHHKGAMASPAVRKLSMEENLMERLREMDMPRDHIRLDVLIPVLEATSAMTKVVPTLSAEDAKKLLRAAQLEVVKSKLRETGKNWISYADFIRICRESCSNEEQGLQYAKLLDESGNAVVLGNIVVLHSDQVAKALVGLLPLPGSISNDPRRKQLMELEKTKAIIDLKADSMVRRELWLGLAFLVVQTAGFIRLTFWELTWDVMEPVCFFLTSMYFMAGYAFFLRTSREPSFEGFYKGRFATKQKQLIRAYNFDVRRYNELKAMFPTTSQHLASTSSVSIDRSRDMQMGALDQ